MPTTFSIEDLRWLIAENADKIAGSSTPRINAIRQLAIDNGWAEDLVKMIESHKASVIWDRLTGKDGAFCPLDTPGLVDVFRSVDPSIFKSPEKTIKFCIDNGLRKNTSPTAFIAAAKLIQASLHFVYSPRVASVTRDKTPQGQYKSQGVVPDLSRWSPKIQDSLTKIDKGILPILKSMRAQCEQQAAKEFPVDTPDYFTVVDHITKRLLPMITRLEAEIVAA
jgi:hypothetical protein